MARPKKRRFPFYLTLRNFKQFKGLKACQCRSELSKKFALMESGYPQCPDCLQHYKQLTTKDFPTEKRIS